MCVGRIGGTNPAGLILSTSHTSIDTETPYVPANIDSLLFQNRFETRNERPFIRLEEGPGRPFTSPQTLIIDPIYS
jgi:hypothetical protein